MASQSVPVVSPERNPASAPPPSAPAGWCFCRDLTEWIIYDEAEMERLGREIAQLDAAFLALESPSDVEDAAYCARRRPVAEAFFATHASVGRTYWISPAGVRITPPTVPRPAPVLATREAHAAFLRALDEVDEVWLPVVVDEPERLPAWVAERESVLAGWDSAQRRPGPDCRAA